MNKLKPCLRCGFKVDINDYDCIYPATRDKSVWEINCYETGGGCGLNLLGDSPEDCIEKWNNPPNNGLIKARNDVHELQCILDEIILTAYSTGDTKSIMWEQIERAQDILESQGIKYKQ